MESKEVNIGAEVDMKLLNHLGEKWFFIKAVEYGDGRIFVRTSNKQGLGTDTLLENINSLNKTSFPKPTI